MEKFKIAIFFSCFILLIVRVLFLLTMQNALRQVQPKNRELTPDQVWIMLIPLVNLFYSFVFYRRVSGSLETEYRRRGHRHGNNYGQGMAMTMPILTLLAVVFVYLQIPFLAFLALLGTVVNLILFIIYWAVISGLKNKLKQIPLETVGK